MLTIDWHVWNSKGWSPSLLLQGQNFHLIVKCQDSTLKLYMRWEVRIVFSYTSHPSFPRHDVRINAALQMPCATLLLAKRFHSSRDDVQKKTVVVHLPTLTSLERCERSLTCIPHNTALMCNVRRQLLPVWSCQLLKRLSCQAIGTRISAKGLHRLWVQFSYIPMASTAS